MYLRESISLASFFSVLTETLLSWRSKALGSGSVVSERLSRLPGDDIGIAAAPGIAATVLIRTEPTAN